MSSWLFVASLLALLLHCASSQDECTPLTGSGILKSPGYDSGSYGNDIYQCWTIGDRQNSVHITVDDIELEESDYCDKDFLFIHKVRGGAWSAQAFVCGRDNPGSLRYRRGPVQVHFASDGSGTGRGFMLSYTVGGNGGGGAPPPSPTTPQPAPPTAAPPPYPTPPPSHSPPSSGSSSCGTPAITPDVSAAGGRGSGNRIIGGEEAVKYSWPWQVSIREKTVGTSGPYSPACGGSIIHPRWVVIAQHCLIYQQGLSEADLKVVAGDHDVSSVSSTEQQRSVRRIIKHPGYTRTDSNDIALLELEEPLQYNDHVHPICLTRQMAAADTTCWSTGWGLDGEEEVQFLQQVPLRLFGNRECRMSMGVDETQLCAGGVRGESTCPGDSGGPLACPTTGGPWTLQGVVSYGASRVCGQTDKPTVYNKVSQSIDWIATHLGDDINDVLID